MTINFRQKIRSNRFYKSHYSSNDSWAFYFRCRLMQDDISGMTDQFAYDEYRALHVID